MAKPVVSSSSQHPPIPCDRIPDPHQYIEHINRVFGNKRPEDMTPAQQGSYYPLLVWGLRDINRSRLICADSEYYSNMIRQSATSKN